MRSLNKIQHQLPARLYLTMLFGFLFVAAHAQYEPMFTQYMFNETFINPAYAGSHENISASVLDRNQWVGIDGAPKTQTFNIHGATGNRKIGLGLSILN